METMMRRHRASSSKCFGSCAAKGNKLEKRDFRRLLLSYQNHRSCSDWEARPLGECRCTGAFFSYLGVHTHQSNM
jgi:hypothetical protein